ncbi:hypothetical protein [Rubrobacter xylanophilus]|uniref:hypothetical protein n=1 Tax=Rubrobacter xylanophilus TaxID=49319 RepID=UPI000324CA21|nr:hypothetical protein [Rubrobacter xylanophilus]
MPAGLALGLLLLLAGLGGVAYGLYALLRGGRGQGGGIGPIPERGVHVIAGLRMLAVGIVCLAAGGYLLWSHLA